FFQAEDGIRDDLVTGVQTCALPISPLRGNLYLKGQFSVGDYPVAVSGDAVIDLDANDDGTLAGVNAHQLAAAVRGHGDLAALFQIGRASWRESVEHAAGAVGRDRNE